MLCNINYDYVDMNLFILIICFKYCLTTECINYKYMFSMFSETAVRASGSANDSFEVGKYRDGTISRRPPQPVPRSPNNMQHKMYSPVMGSVSPCASSSNGTATSGTHYINTWYFKAI